MPHEGCIKCDYLCLMQCKLKCLPDVQHTLRGGCPVKRVDKLLVNRFTRYVDSPRKEKT